MYYDYDLLATNWAKLCTLKMSPTELFNEFYVKFWEYTRAFAQDNIKDQKDLFKKVTYCLSHAAASHNYNDIYNIVAAL